MVRRKSLIENKTYSFGGRQYKGIDLVDNLSLSGISLSEIARILNVDEKRFVTSYEHRLKDLETVHTGLLVKAIFDNALAGDKSSIDTLLLKYSWLDKEDTKNDFVEMLKGALIK